MHPSLLLASLSLLLLCVSVYAANSTVAPYVVGRFTSNNECEGNFSMTIMQPTESCVYMTDNRRDYWVYALFSFFSSIAAAGTVSFPSLSFADSHFILLH